MAIICEKGGRKMKELIYGKNAVLAYLDNKGTPKHIYFQKGGKFQEIESKVDRRRVNITYVSKQALDKMTHGNHQGVVVEIEGYAYSDLNTILQDAKNKLIVVCDQVEDPHNLGAILRTCDAAGVDGLIIGKHRAVGLNATVAKVSTGAIHTVKVAQVTNLVQTLETLKQAGYWVVAAENGVEAISYSQLNVDMPIVLVLGSEGKGISRLVKKTADILVTIPMHGSVNSLNVSVAGGILLFDIVNRRA